MNVARTCWALALGACFAACGDDHVREPSFALEKPLSLDNSLLYVPNEIDVPHAALLLDVERGTVARKELPDGAVHAYPRPGHAGQAALLTEGAAASFDKGRGKDAVPSYVLLLNGSGEDKRFELSARYSQLALSGDGRFAIAFGPSGSWATADNIAVVDLDGDASKPIDSITVRALDGQGPSAVAFAPPSSKRRLAVLVMTDAVNIIDLQRPDARDKVLPLKLPNGSSALRAAEVLFAEDRCFIRPDRGSDVISVRFEDDASDLGFHAALSTLGTASTLADIALLDDSASPRLLALGQNSLRVIDTVSGAGESSSVPAGFGALHTFVGTSPFDSEPRTRALLYGSSGAQLGFVDLQPELAGTERSVEVLSLSGAITNIEFSKTEPLAIIAQRDGKLSFVDLQERTVSSLSADGNINELVLDERAGVGRVWVLTANGSVAGVELAHRTPRALLLDRPATFVVPVTGDKPRVAVGQSANSGAVLLLDAGDPARATAHEIAGFLYNGFLD